MSPDVVREVRQRAQGRCEYCYLPADVYPLPFHVDHLENLALACLHCDRHKGPNIAGRDPITAELIRLFHARVDLWNEQFEWMGAALGGRTAIGRVTIHPKSGSTGAGFGCSPFVWHDFQLLRSSPFW